LPNVPRPAPSKCSKKKSGAKSDRAQLRKAIAALAEGDTLIVTRLDRLAWSARDLLNLLALITDKGGDLNRSVMNGPTPQPCTAGSCLQCLVAWLSLSVS
jgi:DNA invertase Pin-like site-specific DNA recombinase